MSKNGKIMFAVFLVIVCFVGTVRAVGSVYPLPGVLKIFENNFLYVVLGGIAAVCLYASKWVE